MVRAGLAIHRLAADGTAGGHLVRYLEVASLTPRKMNTEPTTRFNHRVMVRFVRSLSLKLAENHAKTRHQIVPVVTNVKPRTINAGIFAGEAGSMNCGRKAKKNSATLGFNTFVTTP